VKAEGKPLKKIKAPGNYSDGDGLIARLLKSGKDVVQKAEDELRDADMKDASNKRDLAKLKDDDAFADLSDL